MTLPTHTATLFTDWAAPATAAPQVQVRLDGRPEPRLRLESLEFQMGSAPRAWFSAGLGLSPQTGEDVRLEGAAEEVRPGRLVRATLLRGGVLPGAGRHDLVLFEGRIGRVVLGLEPDGEALRFEAEDPAGELLRRRVGGRRAWAADGAARRLDGLPLVFNPDGRPNASAAPYAPAGGAAYTIFAPDAGPAAAAWTLDEAAAYLVSEHGGSAAIGLPSPDEVRRALPALVLCDVSLEGRTLGEALEALAALAGARLVPTVEPGETGVRRRLEIWYPGRAPAGWLAHQRVGEVFSPRGTALAALAAQMHFESAPRRYVARGDRRLYESTFDLVPGWSGALESYDPDEFSPGTNPDFGAVRDVFRKWVLNETGEYAAPPYERGPAADLSGVFEGAATVRRRRRFLPCLARDALGRSRGVDVRISTDAGASWQPAGLAVRVLTEECGVVLADAPLPPAYLAAAMRGQVRLRVTATVESDSVLTADCGDAEASDRPGRTRHLNVPAGYRFRRVAPTSRFYGDGGADEADDTARLQDLVRAAWDADRRTPAPAWVQVPWLALGHRVGQRLLGLRGRRLDLARQHDGYATAPVVRRVRFTFAPAPQTELELE